LEAGADDYLTKPFSIHVLNAKVKAMMRRHKDYLSDNLSHRGITVNIDEHKVTVDNRVVQLSSKEFLLLTVLLQNPGKVFTRSRLLNSVWGYDAEVYTRTVDVHISSLRKKLGEQGSLIQSLPKIGYRMEL
jgi:two-component system phosphate regulon response regulator PhoB